MSHDKRTADQIREHYEIEKDLAARLKNSSAEQRRELYTSLYNELFRRVPHHTQLTQKQSREETAAYVAQQMRFLSPFLAPETTFLEIGPGSCALSIHVAGRVRAVYAVDVSQEITASIQAPDNFSLLISDGRSIPAADGIVDVAYSNQLMEHLHPDDAGAQLGEIYRVLRPGGTYVCLTPNRITGPHDISRNFDDVATGFHLREYTTAELQGMFAAVGFRRIRSHIGAKGVYMKPPRAALLLFERCLAALRFRFGIPLARLRVCKPLVGAVIVGTK